MSEVIRGRCFPWDLEGFANRHYVAVVDNTRADKDDIEVTLLPHDGEKVGPFEPWMVDALRGNGLGEVYDTLKDEYDETYTDPFQFDGWLRCKIAAAIEKVLKDGS